MALARSGRRREVALILAVVGAAIVVANLRVLFFDETFTLRDHLTYTIPSRAHLAAELRAGRIPEWWDGVGAGIPFAANPGHGVCYPPAWASALLPRALGADLVLLLHVYLLGVGAALLARRLGAGAGGAAFGGAALVTSGYVTSNVVNALSVLTLAWTPWVALATLSMSASASRRERIRRSAVLAAVIAAQILSGDPAGVDTSVLLSIGLLFACGEGDRLRGACGLAAALLGAALLAAVLVAPAVALLQQSERAGGLPADLGTRWSMHPLRIVEWVWPRALGDPTTEHGHLARLVANAAPGTHLAPSWAASVYVGLPTMALAAFGAWRGRRERILLALSVAFVLLALGRFTPIYLAFRSVVLPERFLRYPEKHIASALLLWCVLAGVGVRRLLDEPASRAMAIAALASSALLAAGVWAALLLRHQLGAALGPGAASLDPPLVVDEALGVGLDAGRSAVALASGFAAALLIAWRSARWRRPAIAVAAVVALFQLVAEAWSIQPTVERELVRRAPALLAPAIASPSGGIAGAPPRRVYRQAEVALALPDASNATHARAIYETAVANVAAPFGFAHVPGYDPALGSAYLHLWREAKAARMTPRFLALAGVELAVVAPGFGAGELSPMALSPAGELVLARVLHPRPRAFVAAGWTFADDGAARAAMLAREPRPGFVTLAPGPSPRVGEARAAPVTPCDVRVLRPESIEVRCDAATPSYAVLLDAWDAGWTATVDGRAAPIERADILFRAVQLPAGAHRIAFSYRTPGLRTGAVVTGLSFAVLLAILLATRRRRGAPLAPRPAV